MLTQIKKILEIAVGVILVIFAGAFLYYQQYVLSVITLILLLVLLRIKQLQKIKINTKTGVSADFKNE
ncbi:MAG: hypothetical protein NTW06_02265 [Candidatus Falkowbacteria bacterium]|nr:hypothetical protein [Candidatus Falkowbacteria bacterium]